MRTTLVLISILATCLALPSGSKDRDGTGDDPPPLYTDVCKPTKGHYDWGGMVLGIATTLVPILLEAVALRESEPHQEGLEIMDEMMGAWNQSIPQSRDEEEPKSKAHKVAAAGLGILSAITGAWKEGDGDEMKKIVACNEAMINEKIEKVWESEVLTICTKAMHSISEDADILKDALQDMEDEMFWDDVNPIYGRIVEQTSFIGKYFANNKEINNHVESLVYLYTSALSAQATAAVTIMAKAKNSTTDHLHFKNNWRTYRTDIINILNDNFEDVKDSIVKTLKDSDFKTKWKGDVKKETTCAIKHSVPLGIPCCMGKDTNPWNWNGDLVPGDCGVKDSYMNKEKKCKGTCSPSNMFNKNFNINPKDCLIAPTSKCDCDKIYKEFLNDVEDQWANIDKLVEECKKTQKAVLDTINSYACKDCLVSSSP